MRHLIIFTVSCFLLLCGTARAAYDIKESPEPAEDGSRVWGAPAMSVGPIRFPFFELKLKPFLHGEDAETFVYQLRLVPFYKRSDEAETFLLQLLYDGSRWAFIHTVKILVDGKVSAYVNADYYRDEYDGTVSEVINVPVPESFFTALDSAKSVSFHLLGSVQNLDFNLNKKKRNNLSSFYRQIRQLE